MPDPGYIRSETCSIRAVASYAHRAGAASDDSRPPAADSWHISPGHDATRILDTGGAWPMNGHHGRPMGAGR
jgi:hypothetical protein